MSQRRAAPPPPIPLPQDAEASTTAEPSPGEDTRPRVFPCEQCGADLTFSIGDQQLACEYCGYVKELTKDPAEIREQDFRAAIAKLQRVRDREVPGESEINEVKCEACGATVQFTGTLTSSECAYCGSPLQREHVHRSPHRIPVDAVLPFLIDHDRAHKELQAWVKSRWFAPNDFLKRGVQGRFNGIYLPFWTYDTLTFNHYTGQRGEHYYVTRGTGKNKRRVRKTRWYPASGSFKRFFDDVLVVAGRGLPDKRLNALEPWPLPRCKPFNAEMLAGFLARTYDVPLDEGFMTAKQRIDAAIRTEVKRRIGGDTQRIHHINSKYDAITYKHLLLPVWMLTYRYRDKPYQVVVNASTGEVQGDRPWSWIKITLAVLGAAALIAGIYFFVQNGNF